MEKYAVVVCPECEYVSVVQQHHKTTKCGRCTHQHKMKKLKKFVTTDSMEKARLVATELRAKQADLEDEFRDAFENGELDLSEYKGVKGPGDWLQNGESESDSRSDKQIVKDSITESTPAIRENIIQSAVESGVNESEAETVLSRLRQQTEVVQNQNGEFRLL